MKAGGGDVKKKSAFKQEQQGKKSKDRQSALWCGH
jgi:hypothetical protein